MKLMSKESLFQVIISAVVSSVVVFLFARYKDQLPATIKKHFKE